MCCAALDFCTEWPSRQRKVYIVNTQEVDWFMFICRAVWRVSNQDSSVCWGTIGTAHFILRRVCSIYFGPADLIFFFLVFFLGYNICSYLNFALLTFIWLIVRFLGWLVDNCSFIVFTSIALFWKISQSPSFHERRASGIPLIIWLETMPNTWGALVIWHLCLMSGVMWHWRNRKIQNWS